MNAMKIVFAALMVALMVLAYTPNVPVAATGTGVDVLTQVVTIKNRIYFVVNLTYLKTTFGWVGTTADIYLSNNGYGTLNPGTDDLLLVKGIYIADADYIMGTLFINETAAYALLGGSNGYLYVKITDGSNVAASNRFYVIFNITEIFEANTYNLSQTSYRDGSIVTNNTLNLTVNISSIGTDINLTTQNFTIKLFSGIETLDLFNQTLVNGTPVYSSEVLNGVANFSTVSAQVVKVNGTLKDFALQGANDAITVQGIVVSFERFQFSIEAWNGTITYNNVIPIEDNITLSDTPYPSYTIQNVSMNIGSLDKTMSIFPSVELVGYTELAGNTTQINPGDNITVKLYNFFNTTDNISVCLFIYGDGKLTGVTTTQAVNTTYGNATVTITLPEAQYGGRLFFVAAKQGASLRGLPATNATVASGPSLFYVMPYLDISFVYNNGTFSDFNAQTDTAPGDYVLVKGHGFIQENITVYSGAASTWYALIFHKDITGASQISVFSNGTFFSLLQIQPGMNPSITPFVFKAEGPTTTNVGYSVITFNIVLNGSVYKSFVNPEPTLTTGLGFVPDAARIIQHTSVPSYPAATPWIGDLSGYSNFTIEIIGVPFTTADIVLTTDNTTFFTAMAGVSFTNGYYQNVVNVPTIPFGQYYAGAYDGTTYYGGYEKKVYINETARAIDPVELLLHNVTVYTTDVFLGEAQNITVLGYGWPGAATVTYTISKGAASYSETFTTNPDGTFNITANISGFLRTHGEGNYTLLIAFNTTVYEIIYIYYSITPPVTVEVYTGTLKLTYPGDTVDVFAIVYLGNSLLDNDTVRPYRITVQMKVYYYDTALHVLVEKPMNYTHEPGIWYANFTVPVTVKGEDILVKVYAMVQPENWSVPKEDVAFASFTVANSLENLLSYILNNISQVKTKIDGVNTTIGDAENNITNAIDNAKTYVVNQIADMLDDLNLTITQVYNKLVVVSETLNETYADVGYLINLAHAINANLTLVYTEVQALNGTLQNSTEEINNNIGTLYLALVAYGNSILANQSIIIAKLDTALDNLGLLIEKVDNNTALIIGKLGSLEVNVTMLIDDLNATLVGLIETKSGAILGQIQTTEGNLTATMNALYNLTEQGINMAKEQVLASIANLSSNLTTYASKICNRLKMFQNETMNKFTALEELVTTAKGQVVSEIMNASGQLSLEISSAEANISAMVESVNVTVLQQSDAIKAQIDSTNKTITNLIKSTSTNIINELSKTTGDLSTKIDNMSKDLSTKIEESNNAVKGRVTTMTSVSTVVLLAAIVAMSVIKRTPT